MPARASSSALSPRLRRGALLVVAVAAGTAAAAFAQSDRIPDLRIPPPRIATAPPPGQPCPGCGRILAVREVVLDESGRLLSTLRAPGPGTADPGSPSPSQGPLVGAVIFLPLGGQGGDRPYVGGVGTPEMYARLRQTTYEVAVKLDDGAIQLVRSADGSRFAVGDRVRWGGGDELELLAN